MGLVPTSFRFIKEVNTTVTVELYDGATVIQTIGLQPDKDIRTDENYPNHIIIPINTTGGHANNKFLACPWEKIDFVNSSPSNTAPTTVDEAIAILMEDFFFELGGGGGVYIFTNGLNEVGGSVKLGGLLTNNTSIDTDGNDFEILSGNAKYLSADVMSFPFAGIYSDASGTHETLIGIVDGSSFPADPDFIFIGAYDGNFSTPLASIQVIPSTRQINIKANDSTGDYNLVGSYEPNSSTPAIVHELQKNADYAIGFAAISTMGDKYSNIYYGTLDSNNNITDINRVLVNQSYVELMTDGGVHNVKLFMTGDFVSDMLNFVIKNLGDYADDTAAAAGGVPLSGLYHTSGTVKIRLT